MSFQQFGIKLAYEQVEKRGDKLKQFNECINWKRFQLIFFRQSTNGRPPYSPIVMFKVLILQHLYGISDEELEYQISDRVSFQSFLGFPSSVPDHSTIWRFREYLAEADLHDKIWDELHVQMQKKGRTYAKGIIQDASIITSNPGKTNSGMQDRGRGQASTRNEDGSWVTKNGKSQFGYKLHTKVESSQGIITELAVTTASVHDNQIDLSEEDEIAYRDKGYFGAKPRAKGDATMHRAARGHPLSPKEWWRNKRISKGRAPGERPFAVVKNVLKGAHTLYTELHRVFTQQFMNCFVYNVLQIRRLC